MNENKNEYKGYTLFNDIEDAELRNRNRAVIMSNIVEFNTRNSKVTPKGAAMVIGYFSLIPENERLDVNNKFEAMIKERGYVTRTVH